MNPQIGRRYITRIGLVTSPLEASRGLVRYDWPFTAMLDGRPTHWDRAGFYDEEGIGDLDLVKEFEG